jgi:hypothetical protein
MGQKAKLKKCLKTSKHLHKGAEAALILLERDLKIKCDRLYNSKLKSYLGISSEDYTLKMLNARIHQWLLDRNKSPEITPPNPVPKPPYSEEFRTVQLNLHAKELMKQNFSEGSALALQIAARDDRFDQIQPAIREIPVRKRLRPAAEQSGGKDPAGLPEAAVLRECEKLVQGLKATGALSQLGDTAFSPLGPERHATAQKMVFDFLAYVNRWEQQHGISREKKHHPADSKGRPSEQWTLRAFEVLVTPIAPSTNQVRESMAKTVEHSPQRPRSTTRKKMTDAQRREAGQQELFESGGKG